ncbi:myb-like protein X [Capsicum annuum]|uniref:myb-like protein X n=1 Tax=Capsicum annuum TaxID=4072 RepID=UPI001FB09953|nr:myb-like protein X [Capsicum annuum]
MDIKVAMGSVAASIINKEQKKKDKERDENMDKMMVELGLLTKYVMSASVKAVNVMVSNGYDEYEEKYLDKKISDCCLQGHDAETCWTAYPELYEKQREEKKKEVAKVDKELHNKVGEQHEKINNQADNQKISTKEWLNQIFGKSLDTPLPEIEQAEKQQVVNSTHSMEGQEEKVISEEIQKDKREQQTQENSKQAEQKDADQQMQVYEEENRELMVLEGIVSLAIQSHSLVETYNKDKED